MSNHPRGPRPKRAKPARARSAVLPLSQERILRSAITLADVSGIESLSMRRLADGLGVEAMSLYNHVTNKEEMLDGIVEMVMSEIYVPSAGTDWRQAMRRRAISAHEVLVRHPWASALSESRTSLGPVRLKYCDAVLGVLRGAGFPIDLAYNAFLLLDSYIYGFTLQEVNWPHEPKDIPIVVEKLTPLISEKAYPNLTEVMAFVMRRRAKGASTAAKATKRSAAYEAEFEFGLDLMLDGLERARPKGNR